MLRVLVQAGHLAPREPGFESGTGTPGEIELVTAVRDELVRLLELDGRFEPVPVPGAIPRGIVVDAALFLHADGSSDPRAGGFSFGYPLYPVNKRLADLIAGRFEEIPGHPPHRLDNYTRDLAGYYGFGLVDTPGPEVVIEHGFLTNPAERAWLLSHVAELARAEYLALLDYFGLEPDGRNAARLATLRTWILKQVQAGRSWAWVKRTHNWREFRRRGGK